MRSVPANPEACNNWTPNALIYSHLPHYLLIHLQSPVKLMSSILILRRPIHHRRMAMDWFQRGAQEDTEEKSGIGRPTTQSQVTQKEDDIRTATTVQLIKGCNKKPALVRTKWLQISGVQCWWTNSLVLMRVVVFFCLLVFLSCWQFVSEGRNVGNKIVFNSRNRCMEENIRMWEEGRFPLT